MALSRPPIALWVTPVSDLGGVARHFLDVARVGVPGWQLVFLSPPGELPERLRLAGAEVVEAPFGPAAGLAASVATLRRVADRLRPRLVHTHLSYADLVAPLALPRTILVTTEHGIARDDLVYHRSRAKARIMARAHALRSRRFAGLIAVSAATAAAMREKWRPGRSITVIPNGVDVPDLTPARPGLRVLSLARLAPEKRLESLVDAFTVLVRQHPAATLTIAGVGPEEQALRDRIGQVARIRLPGFLDAESAMRQADVVAMLSVWENCSYTLLDAAAHGLGVVAAPVGGNPEILPTRCLADPGDPTEVAARIAEQGLDPAQRPGLVGWPTVSDMTAAIASVYHRLSE